MSLGWRKNGSQRQRLLARVAPEILAICPAFRAYPDQGIRAGAGPDGARLGQVRVNPVRRAPRDLCGPREIRSASPFGTCSTEGDRRFVRPRCRYLHLLEAAGVHTGGSVSRHPK